MENIQDLQSGRMSKEHSAVTEEKTSGRCWNRLQASQGKTFLFLDATKDGIKQDALSEILGVSHGDFSMLNIGVSPSVERESHLLWILQDNVPEKYSLSPKACNGILARASKRGKELPLPLKNALENVVRSKSVGGSDTYLDGDGKVKGAGKGALVQNDLSGTLGVSQDQTLFCSSMGHDERNSQFLKNGKADNLTASDYKQPTTVAFHIDRNRQ